LPTANLSEYLADFHMAFGNNAFEILHEDHTKSFGALMTFQEYNEIDDSVLDKLLHLDQPFVITQTLNFVHHKEARQKYQQQKYIADLADAKNVRKLSGIDEIMADDNNSYVDYGEQQLTIMPTSDSIIGLNKNIDEMFYALFELGLIALREDLLMEDCFWSQLPANFSFISRQTYTSTSRVAGFSSLNTFPTGHKVRNHWGKAVTVFYTEHGAPYFFNFHHQDNGHTIIIGPEGSGKTVLLNFLLSESRKFNSKLFFFDQKKASKVFINAIGGKYYNIMNTPNNRNRLYLNPLQLQDTTKNKIFIVSWLGDLITSAGGILNKKDYDIIEKAVHEVYDLGEPERRIAQICKALGKLDRIDLAVHLQIWYGNGELAHVFDNEEDGIINAPGLIHGFNMDSVTHDSRLLAPVLAYYFHIIELSLDGSPVMIVLDEAWKLIDNDLFASHIREWLDYLREKNAMVIFATESLDDIANSKITYSLIEKVATQIYLPNSNVDDNNHGAYQDVFRLNDKELSLLMSMEVEERQFLLKHGNEAVIAKLDLKSMKELLVLSGGEHTEQVMNELIGSVGSEPDHWLPQFYKELS
jgi:type IV secretion system protein VirB4